MAAHALDFLPSTLLALQLAQYTQFIPNDSALTMLPISHAYEWKCDLGVVANHKFS